MAAILLVVSAICTLAAGQKVETLKIGEATVRIVRDRFGVPHIYAPSLYGVFYGSGYAQAQDRLAQMELYRRTAKGELAEIMGESALDQDKQRRTLGYTEAERWEQFASLSPEEQLVLKAFADGINAIIAQVNAGKRPMPQRLKDLGVTRLRPWKVTDTIAIAHMMAERFGSSGGEELRMMQLRLYLQLRFGAQAMSVLNDLAWQNDPTSPTTVTGDTGQGTRKTQPKKQTLNFLPCPVSPVPLLTAIRIAEEWDSIEWCKRLGLFTRFGSYAMVVAPKKSATGNPLLVGGPQMATGTPSIAYEIALYCPKFKVRGMTFPGIPIVLIGMNRYLAWTTTSGAGDNVDIFVEHLSKESKYRYMHNGEWRPMERRIELIFVKGKDEPVQVEVCRTVHGVVLSWDEKAGIAYARAKAYWGKELGALRAIYAFHKATNIKEFAEACRYIATSHNFFVATKDGDIGFWFCGRYPVRAEGIDPRFPTPGTGEFDWKGFVPFEKLPQQLNPPQGFFANWNNKPAPWWDNGDLPRWGAIHHVKRIIDLLRSKPKLTLEDLRRFVVDIEGYDVRADFFKPLLLRAIRKVAADDVELKMIADLLQRWDNQRSEGSVAATIFDAWFEAMQDIVFSDDLGDFGDKSLFRMAIQPSLLWYVLADKPPRKLSRDYLNGEDKDLVMVKALRTALERLRKERGEIAHWGFRKPLWRFDPLPPIPGPNRGAYIQLVEVTSPPRGFNILPPGQSEDPKSPHYSDQHPLALRWQFKVMELVEALKVK
ncbi:penicillin acylase family protein [Fervidibacter sacchari]|uniref:Penicillin amidase n=1 Tax=Candidatus Fervidibacter sacchari TaxID=1448929 RepID=A0ABT2ELB0_9BACT|nr:penicillin acylase family protein [Candidatus Fervidibacter sacchari]MCS3918722.1 penicillin amidase [Candidatus Fervidibacter sacchari]WKU17525.1 penicillin acylase family protein [Candidatus Fervidibacter sacchari]